MYDTIFLPTMLSVHLRLSLSYKGIPLWFHNLNAKSSKSNPSFISTQSYEKMSSEEKLKQRAIIQFCVSLGHTPVQTMEMLNKWTRTPFAVRTFGIQMA